MSSRIVKLITPGSIPYGQALALQLKLRAQLQREAQTPDELGYLICLEHPLTITLGKRGKLADLLGLSLIKARDVPVFKVDRGGQATCHEPGQLVIYPVLRLEPLGMGVVDLIRAMANALAETLALWGVTATYDQDSPGLWTEGGAKIASVGMRVSGGVTTHGLSVNLNNTLEGFGLIVPCGMPDSPLMTLARALHDEDRAAPTREQFLSALLPKLAAIFNASLTPCSPALPEPEDWEPPLSWDEA